MSKPDAGIVPHGPLYWTESLLSAIAKTQPVFPYHPDGARSGLFQTLLEEEKKIREDPAARSTALLRQVFGSVSSGASG